MQKNTIKVLYVASEVYPLIKTGGLGDVAGSLPVALAKQGCDVRVLMPYYSLINQKLNISKKIASITIENKTIAIIESRLPGTRIKLWCCDYAPYFDRKGSPYCDLDGKDWSDNAQRFDLLCQVAVLLACNQASLKWRADVVHCNDWQTGLIPVYLQHYTSRPASIFTIHNLAYQGLFSQRVFKQLGLDQSLWCPEALEYYGKLSFIKGGIIFADQINTVSPRYAIEIQTPEFGNGLEGLLQSRQRTLSGILNGIDTRLWHPWHDPFLYVNYNNKSLDIKHTNKMTVQAMFNFPKNKDRILIGMVSRVVEQKGVLQIIAVIPKLSELGIQMVLLGCGDRIYESQLLQLAKKYPTTFSAKIGYSENIAHMITAGVDAYLMPSIFEPCGLSQMYSLRYGSLPIVRAVGGLVNTVIDFVASEQSNKAQSEINLSIANGFVMRESEDLLAVILRCLDCYANKKLWSKLQHNAMAQDFSWQRSAKAYLALYLLAKQKHAHSLDEVS